MDSLVTLAICIAIGLFFEPGWRLMPGARHHMTHEHGEEHEEHAQPPADAQHGEHGEGGSATGVDPQSRSAGSWLGQAVAWVTNGQVGHALGRGGAGVGGLLASWGVWLRSPTGVEVAIPYALLFFTGFLWWQFADSLKVKVPSTPPVSPLAPKLALDEQEEPEDPNVPLAAMVFFFGVGLGLAVARAVYRWSIADLPQPPEPVTFPKVIGAMDAKKAPSVQPRTTEMHKTGTLHKAVVKNKGSSMKRSSSEEAMSTEDLEKADGQSKSKEKIPEEHAIWTPQNSWAAPSHAASGEQSWTPQTSWGDATQAAAKAAADAVHAG